MSRPPSIVAFERLYLASIAVYILNGAIFWSASRALVAGAPQVQAVPALSGLIGPIMLGSLIVTVLVSLLFWHLVARRRSVAGKWLVVVTEAIGAALGVMALLRLVSGTAANPANIALGLLSTALAVAAAVVLFRADARAWLVDDVSEEARA